MVQGVYAKEDCVSSTGLAKTTSLRLWGRGGRKQASLFITARLQTATADLVGFVWFGFGFFSPTSGVTIFLAEFHILLLTDDK